MVVGKRKEGNMIQKNWQELIKPNKVEFSSKKKTLTTLVAEPLERGFGLTLGNALRRVLLSSLRGAAVTAVQIDGVLHEFSSIGGVREDVTDIVLNIKEIAIKMEGDGPKRMVVRKQGPGAVLAGDIQTVGDVEILNPDHVICTLDEGAEIRMEFTVDTGKGYVPAERNRAEDAPIGLIPVDSLYSPVKKVSYKVENTREGQVLDYDKLTMTIETDGSVTGEDAVAFAARILQDQLALFVNFDEPQKEVATEAVTDTIDVGLGPVDVVFSPDGATAWVTNNAEASVSVIDTATATVTDTIAVAPNPSAATITAHATRLHVGPQTAGPPRSGRGTWPPPASEPFMRPKCLRGRVVTEAR